MDWREQALLIIGAGGHAKVLVNALQAAGAARLLGLCDTDTARHGSAVLGLPILGGDEVALRHAPDSLMLVNGLGATRAGSRRRDVYRHFKEKGYRFAQAIHPSAVIASSVQFSEGVQIMAGCVIQPDCVIHANVLINTHASVDHDCVIHAHSHIAPGAVLSGGVVVGEGAHIGAGAVLIQGVKVGAGVTIGAGAVVLHDLPDHVTAFGVPARMRV